MYTKHSGYGPAYVSFGNMNLAFHNGVEYQIKDSKVTKDG
jgi:hypothetical protein